MLVETNVAFAGSFNPLTLGHVNLIQRACKIFNKVILIQAKNSNKNNYQYDSTVALERLQRDHDNFSFTSTSGLVVESAREHGCNCLIRGVRHTTDLEQENALAEVNMRLGLPTIYIPVDSAYSTVSSSLVRSLLRDIRDEDVLAMVLGSYVPGSMVRSLIKERNNG